MPVMLSCGDGAQGEPQLLACACQLSSLFLARVGCKIGLLLTCALGCGEALKDGGSQNCAHADEVPCAFASWLNHWYMVRVSLWRAYRSHILPVHVATLRARCATLKCATLEISYQEQPVYSLNPIDFASWAEKRSMPHVLEPRRPSKSDPQDTMLLLTWWCHYAKFGSFSNAISAPIEQQVTQEPRGLAAGATLASSTTIK